jgi:hypothetical protein
MFGVHFARISAGRSGFGSVRFGFFFYASSPTHSAGGVESKGLEGFVWENSRLKMAAAGCNLH